ncbi:MATE family efflux transporter [Aquabacterium sp.]|uniref:MATE family efflux transporter n=1 Tax=Aquabacterium sp. TaxID=1872578 RepID=UPI002C6B411B|nr:MATE family efflux transporter [Aquabacterium sp.]HSW05085.1 MATE family efflux transporter [Aquabacterium sp.]
MTELRDASPAPLNPAAPSAGTPQRPLPQRLLPLAWPLFIEQSLHILTGVVDTFMVSFVSDGAAAALAVANQLVIWFIIVFNFIGIGAMVVVTHHLGANDRPGADRVASTAIAVCTWLGLIASAVIALAAAPLLRLLQLPADLMPYAQPFLAVVGAGLVIEAVNLAIGSVLRAHARTREVMVVSVLQNVINVIGNAIALFGWFGLPQYGVVGVAVSTVFSRAVACAVLWLLLAHRAGVHVRLRAFFNLQRETLGRVLHIGAPAAGENISWWTAFMVVTSFTARMGEQPLAAHTYWMSIAGFMILFSSSIGMATEILVGHQVGAGQFEQAYKLLLRSLRTAFGVACVVALAIGAAAPWIMSAFSRDPTVLALGTLLLRLSLVLESGRTFNLVVINALRASGDARFPFYMGLLSMWGVWVPLAWLFGLQLGWGLLGIWLACVCDEWFRGLLMYRRWRQRRWLKYAQRTQARVGALRDAAAGPGA